MPRSTTAHFFIFFFSRLLASVSVLCPCSCPPTQHSTLHSSHPLYSIQSVYPTVLPSLYSTSLTIHHSLKINRGDTFSFICTISHPIVLLLFFLCFLIRTALLFSTVHPVHYRDKKQQKKGTAPPSLHTFTRNIPNNNTHTPSSRSKNTTSHSTGTAFFSVPPVVHGSPRSLKLTLYFTISENKQI